MPKKETFKNIMEEVFGGKEVEITNNCINGKCSKCGECCSNFLPVTENELKAIEKYVLEHNIQPQTHMLIMQNRLSCPYYDGKKCLIYEVRPLICQKFYCNKTMDMYEAQEFSKERRITVSMWTIAEVILKEQLKNEGLDRK